MYRIVFFKIPFMRNGYRVPATPFGDSPISHMAAYKVAEIVTDFAFAETQREIVVNGDTAVAIDNGAANYAYIAQTNSETIGVYTNDRRPAYYWVDDLQFVGVSDGTPAAIVTISPDVWLTDFFPNMPTVRGRLAQSTKLMAGEPRTPLVAPVYDTSQLVQYDALVANGAAGFYVVGVFSTERGGIAQYIMFGETFADVKSNTYVLSGAVSITSYLDGKPGLAQNISCIRVYVLPGEFLTTTDGTSLVETFAGSRWEYKIKTAYGDEEHTVWEFVRTEDLDGVGLRRVKNVNTPSAAAGLVLNDINCRSWIVTPGRFVELSAQRGIKTPSGADPTLAAFFLSANTSGDDGIKIYLQVGEEFIDVSDDFVADIAPNETAVQQAQQKQLVALQAITGVIGAAGGVAGGVASGNYFGAVQAAAGGIETIAGISAERRRPPQMKSNGGVAAFYGFAKTLVLLVSTGSPGNSSLVNDTEEEFGWKYDNAPFVKYEWPDIDFDNFYRFSDVVVENVTGGTSAAEEIATAFATGVRLVSL